jgi:glycine/serine hydroxymethyltransferase
MKEADMVRIAGLIDTALQAPDDAGVSERVRADVRELTAGFPLYPVPVAATSG